MSNCRFIRNGNDGVDLMESEIAIVDSEWIENGDKGVSVGEQTRAVILNGRFVGNGIGSQVKDESQALYYNCTFERNQKSLDSYNKNWRYRRGGTVHVWKSVFRGNAEQITSDRRSQIFVYDSYCDASIAARRGRIELAEVDDGSQKVAKHRRVQQAELPGLARGSVFEALLLDADPARRGAK